MAASDGRNVDIEYPSLLSVLQITPQKMEVKFTLFYLFVNGG